MIFWVNSLYLWFWMSEAIGVKNFSGIFIKWQTIKLSIIITIPLTQLQPVSFYLSYIHNYCLSNGINKWMQAQLQKFIQNLFIYYYYSMHRNHISKNSGKSKMCKIITSIDDLRIAIEKIVIYTHYCIS